MTSPENPGGINPEPCPYCQGYHPLSAQFCPVTGQPLLPDDSFTMDTNPGSAYQISPRPHWLGIGLGVGAGAIVITLALLLFVPVLSRSRTPSSQSTFIIPTLPALTTQIGSSPAPITTLAAATFQAMQTAAAAGQATATPKADDGPWQACPNIYESRLRVGNIARVTEYPYLPNRVRSGPGTDFPVLGYVEPGEEVEIIQGPECANNWVWWRVRSQSTGLDGWTAEGSAEYFWLEPVP
jgi:hypothetical protein